MKKEINVLKFKPFRSLIAPAKKGRSVAKIHIISIILCPLRNSYHSIRRKHQVFYWILWPGCCWQPHSTQHCNSLWVLYTTSSSSLSFSYASDWTDSSYSSSPKQTANLTKCTCHTVMTKADTSRHKFPFLFVTWAPFFSVSETEDQITNIYTYISALWRNYIIIEIIAHESWKLSFKLIVSNLLAIWTLSYISIAYIILYIIKKELFTKLNKANQCFIAFWMTHAD